MGEGRWTQNKVEAFRGSSWTLTVERGGKLLSGAIPLHSLARDVSSNLQVLAHILCMRIH